MPLLNRCYKEISRESVDLFLSIAWVFLYVCMLIPSCSYPLPVCRFISCTAYHNRTLGDIKILTNSQTRGSRVLTNISPTLAREYISGELAGKTDIGKHKEMFLRKCAATASSPLSQDPRYMQSHPISHNDALLSSMVEGLRYTPSSSSSPRLGNSRPPFPSPHSPSPRRSYMRRPGHPQTPPAHLSPSLNPFLDLARHPIPMSDDVLMHGSPESLRNYNRATVVSMDTYLWNPTCSP